MKTIQVVKYGHVKWRSDGSFLTVAVDMDIFIVGMFISKPMYQRRITMVSKYDGFVACKKQVKVFFREAVWMLCYRLEFHQIDHIDDPDPIYRW